MPSCNARPSCRAARRARREFMQSDCYQNAIAEVDKLLADKSERDQLKLLHAMADHAESRLNHREENMFGQIDKNIFFRSLRTPDLESVTDAVHVHRAALIEQKAKSCASRSH